MARPSVFVTRIIPEKGLKLVQDFCDVDLWNGIIDFRRQVFVDLAA